jgi:hypothetical protein
VRQVADEGCGALLVSDELDDLRIAHRVLVMFKGAVVAEFPAGWTDAELIAAVEGLGGSGDPTDPTDATGSTDPANPPDAIPAHTQALIPEPVAHHDQEQNDQQNTANEGSGHE